MRASVVSHFRAYCLPREPSIDRQPDQIRLRFNGLDDNLCNTGGQLMFCQFYLKRLRQRVEYGLLPAKCNRAPIRYLKRIRFVQAVKRQRFAQDHYIRKQSGKCEQILVGFDSERFRHLANLPEHV